jgi:hypothetical protein
MEQKPQTKVTPENQKDFYRSLYKDSRTLVELDQLPVSEYLLVDCNQAQYRKKYPNLNIVLLTTLSTAKQFNLSRDQFDYLIDNRIHNDLHWPKISTTSCAIIFDYSILLKYLTVPEIINVLETVSGQYSPTIILLRSSLFFIDDSRSVDRFYNLVDIKIDNYVIEKFYYDTLTTELMIQFKIKHHYDNPN